MRPLCRNLTINQVCAVAWIGQLKEKQILKIRILGAFNLYIPYTLGVFLPYAK